MVSSIWNPLVIRCRCVSINPGRINPPFASIFVMGLSGILSKSSGPTYSIILFLIKITASLIGLFPVPSINVPLCMKEYAIFYHLPIFFLSYIISH